MSTVSYYLLGTIGFLSVARACIPSIFGEILLIIWSIGGFFGTAYLLRSIKLEPDQSNYPIFLTSQLLFSALFLSCHHSKKNETDNGQFSN